MTAAPALLHPQPSHDHWASWALDWELELKANRRAAGTILAYLGTLERWADWATARGLTAPEQVTRRDVRAWIAWLTDKRKANGAPISATYVAQHVRQLRVFWTFWAAETDQPGHPMQGVRAPKVERKLTPIVEDDDLRRLDSLTSGTSFADRRDRAIIRVLFDTGLRRAELVSLRLDDVDLPAGLARVKGKGGDHRWVSLSSKTVQALTRYLRARSSHPDAGLPDLWLALPPRHRGPLQGHGLAHMLKTRGRAAGIAGHLHPHRLRHTAFDAMEASGQLTGGDAMRIMGWRSRAMLDHYGASNQTRRALAAAKKASVGDRI